MKILNLLIAPSIFFCTTAFAADKYVDGANGLDTNSGSISAPYKTISKAVNTGNDIAAGDTIYVHAGVYREKPRPVDSGTATSPITLRDYGDGEVVIDASVEVDGWEVDTGSIYKATPGFVVGGVIVDETPLYPATSVTVAGVGTEMTTRAAVTLGEGQYFQDQNTGILYVWTPNGSSPANHTLGVIEWTKPSSYSSVYDAIYTYNKSYWVLKNITVRFSSARGINITGDSASALDGSGSYPGYWMFDNVTVKFNYHHGIVAGNHATVKNSHVYHACMNNFPRGKWGALGGWGGGVTARQAALFENNVVHDNGGEGILSFNDAVGNNVWRGNTVYDNWSVNIYTDNEAGSLIENNLVYGTPLDLNKMFNNGVGEALDYKKKLVPIGVMTADEDYYQGYVRFSGATIRNNLIIGCKKATSHNRETNTSSSGIKNTKIINNTIVTPSGLFNSTTPPGSGDNYVGISIPYNSGNNSVVIANNIVISRGSVNYSLYGIDDGATWFSGATISNNIWYNPDSPYPINYGPSTSGNTTTDRTFTEYLALSGAVHGVGDLSADPLYVDLGGTTAASYAIQANSPAKGAGSTTSSSTDFNGFTWLTPASVGALEYGSVPINPTAAGTILTNDLGHPMRRANGSLIGR